MPQCLPRKFGFHAARFPCCYVFYLTDMSDIMISGTERHTVNMYNVNGSFLSSVEPYSSFLQQHRSSPIAVTAFHPHRMMLACAGLGNTHVNLFGCQGT